MNHESFNNSVIRLWEKYFDDSQDIYVPLILPPLVFNGLLFIGNNPSFSPDGFRRFLADTSLAHIDPHEFFHWKNRRALDLEIAIQIERLAKDRYPYFKKFRDLSAHAEMDWEHIDLFFFRETSQNNFKKRIFNRNGLTDFGTDQLKLSKSLIEEIKPKIIVVVNAFASDLFLNEYNAVFDENEGFHKILLNNRTIPVFLGSMLTGQRAMDRYSYQRLKWHISKVVNRLNVTTI